MFSDQSGEGQAGEGKAGDGQVKPSSAILSIWLRDLRRVDGMTFCFYYISQFNAFLSHFLGLKHRVGVWPQPQ